ncbi:MAG: 5-formyltetrahydrofolate cyclo-ligase [Acidimicrobiaceae bacterium]|nr:5-formyltetrahydrofolate cyclo-ligase [Acidimicrobiaceae bacterium]
MPQSSNIRKARIRDEMLHRRARLSKDEDSMAGASKIVSARLEALPLFKQSELVAAYKAVRGEISLEALTEGEHWEKFTFPRIKETALEFVARSEGQVFTRGSFGITEPVDGEVIALSEHDIVLVPIVAFDENCNRIGNGGGYYDRALAGAFTVKGSASSTNMSAAPPARSPITIGVAHEFQQVAEVPVEPWDVPLDGIVTDAGLFTTSLSPEVFAR